MRKNQRKFAEHGGQSRVLAIVAFRVLYPVFYLMAVLGSVVMAPVQLMGIQASKMTGVFSMAGAGPFNQPALWRATKFQSFNYPITNVASVQGSKAVVYDLKKYLTGDSDYLSRIFVRISGNIVKAGAGPGVATGKDNPYDLLVSANLATSPVFGNTVPLNSVSQRMLSVDAAYNGGFDARNQAAVTDAAATVAVDFTVELNFKRSQISALDGIDYVMPLNQYRNATLTLVFGGRDQLFTGGTNTWDLSGLTVDLFADIDMGINPGYIHAHELYENIYPVLASNTNFKIDNLPSGFVYTDLYILSEDAGALTAGIVNNISIQNGSQTWTLQGENNAANLKYMFARDNYRQQSGAKFFGLPANDLTGVHAFPLRDGMFTRGFDCRYSPMIITLNVTSLSATTQIRLGGRRMIPGGIYQRPKSVQVK